MYFDNDLIALIPLKIVFKGIQARKARSLIFPVKMKFAQATLVVLSMFIIVAVVCADPVQYSCLRDDCTDDDFDKMVCASNGEETRTFMGSCRFKQYNFCNRDDGKSQI